MNIVKLPNYSDQHHINSKFRNEPGEPRVSSTTNVTFGNVMKFICSKKDCQEKMQVRQIKNDFLTDEEVKIWWISHATILIKYGDKYTITDPQFDYHASPFPGHIRRTAPPPCKIEDIPKIDYVVISHDHWDHLNTTSLSKIKKSNPDVIIITTLGVGDLVKGWGYKTVSLDWRQKVEINDIAITCFPARHHTARYGNDGCKRLWASFLFTYKNNINFYFPGDTAIGPHFKEVYEYVGKEIDLVSIPIGPQEPIDMMRKVHLNPIDASDMTKELHAKVAFPMHFGTFPLGMKPEEHDVDVLLKNWDAGELHIIKNGGLMILDDNGKFVPASDECMYDVNNK